ncbi:Response regulator [Treponema sp. JC4]|uniref:ANTAR domain-containing response regulator n=1 Tax=Treponema sp. JC4 TaxID=1124982 RepID=UPI00025B0A5A|nr:ANTAR domain-containing protein [Treponema sp. JC4]EID85448.1 Response regulator [Treponema sp. JC4]
MTEDRHSVLLVTKDPKLSQLVSVMLMPPLFEVDILSDFNEARRRVSERVYNIILADYADGEGSDFALDASDSLSTILLLTPPAIFEEVSYRVEGYGIISVTNPFDQFYFYNMIKAAIAVQYKVQILSSQTTKLKNKMEEIKLVNRAKMLLMQNLNMTEQEAHHYIEKEAMNRGLKKTSVAENVVKTYA